ncbi:MAG: DUF4493 domain-containing protein [Rikenellaceae bacterium]|nr:DUF4493 domain-containing protein [Rikenellaceae bacterium]
MRRLLNIVLCACALALASCVGDGKVNDLQGGNTPSEDKGVLTINVGTRSESDTVRDYILSIYKNEGGKSTLVRKYDSSKEDMQKPQYIWLLAGNYTAKVECGEAVAATFNESEQYLYGEKDFDITAGETKTVDLVAVMQNIPVEVVFDQTIIDGFHEGYNVEVKADDNVKLTYTESKKGYFIMPKGVTSLSWHFVGTFEYDDNGELVNVDKSGTLADVELKKGYKLSFKFSKDAIGLFGGISVTVDESIEEREDHFAFNPDPELKGDGFDIGASCNYAGGDRRYVATSPAEFCAVSIVAGGKEYNPVEESVAGVTLSGLNTTKLYVTLSDDFFNALSGGAQVIELCVTDTSGGEARKDLPYHLQGVNGYDNANEVLAWAGGTTSLSATVFGTPSSVQITYRKGEGEWLSSDATSSGANRYTATVGGIEANTTYEYNLVVNGKTVGTSLAFTTRDGNQIPNGGLEDWSTSGKVAVPFHTADNAFWCTGNWGAADYVGNITNSSSDVRPGSKGRKSAYLDSTYAVIKFAAGNLYVGSWGGMDGLQAKVYFGQPFIYNAKPKAIRFWAKWKCGTINREQTGKGKKGDPDLCKIFCCMCNWESPWMVHSGKAEATTFSPSDANIKSGDARYNGVLYSAYMDTTESKEDWHLVEIPFVFYGTDPNEVPNHLVLTFTCSGYGDFFDGSEDSWMYIDDIELVY